MPRSVLPFQFRSRPASSTVVHQNSSSRTTLRLGLVAAEGTTTTASSGGGGGGGGGGDHAPAPRPSASTPAPAQSSAPALGRGGRSTSGGWRGRRGWWGETRRRVPPSFVEFWRQPEGTRSRAATIQSQRRQYQQRGRSGSSSWFLSPEVAIFVLGLAALLAFIVFISDILTGREFRPMAVLVFVAAGTYCIALIKQQRILASAEQEALVIEIMDGASADGSRRRVISKEERRSMFEYFTFHPGEASRAAAAAEEGEHRAVAAEAGMAATGGSTVEGGGSKRGVEGEAGAKPSPPSSGAKDAPDWVGGVEGGEWGTVFDTMSGVTSTGPPDAKLSAHRDEGVVVAPSSGTSAPLSPFPAVAPTADGKRETIGDASEDCRTRLRPLPGPEHRGIEEAKGCELLDKGEAPAVTAAVEANGGVKGWATAGSCIVCFGDYADGDKLCRLPCWHTYHAECIDAWLDGPDHAWCPVCKSSLLPSTESRHNSAVLATGATNGGDGRNADQPRAPPAAVTGSNVAAGVPTGDAAV